MKILFIVHEATRTGAPVVLLSLLQWLKKHKYSFDVLLLKDGPLRKDFEDIAQTYFIPFQYKYSLVNKIRRRLHPELLEEYKIYEVVNKLKRNNYTVIYGNTIVSLPWLLHFKKYVNAKVVCAVHELSFIIEYHFNKEYVLQGLGNIDLILAGSYAVEKNLVKNFKVAQEKIKVVHAFIDTDFKFSKDGQTLRDELGIKNTHLIVGGMGTADLRKGTDLVIPLAIELKDKYPEVLFKLIWVGGLATDLAIKLFKQDAKRCGVEDSVIFIDNTSSPEDYINLYDVFVLLSREDPFPLVLLTAASMQKVGIAFDKSGGAPELLNGGSGFIAPYLNIKAVAKIISNLYHNRELIKETGKKAKEKVEKEFSADVIPARVLKILHEL